MKTLLGLSTFATIAMLTAAHGEPAIAGRLEGIVRDTSGEPIPSAQVRVIGTAFGGVADGNGRYFINNLPAGKVDLSATFVGFRKVEVKGVPIVDDSITTQDFALEDRPVEMAIDAFGPNLEGVVTTPAGIPISGAIVEVAGLPAATTDSAGHFWLSPPSGRKMIVRVTADGYRKLEVPVDKLKEGENRRLFLRLKQ